MAPRLFGGGDGGGGHSSDTALAPACAANTVALNKWPQVRQTGHSAKTLPKLGRSGQRVHAER